MLVNSCFFNSVHSQFSIKKTTNLELKFSNYVGNELLVLDTITYLNELNQEFNVTKFKYYVSRITLQKLNGEEFSLNSHFLIDQETKSSSTIQLNEVPIGEYSSIRFTIGVDSLSNCSGAQTGVLDPINGMFWTWNSGYIFMKLEGVSSASVSPLSIFEYHIGGYRTPYNLNKTITLPFISPRKISSMSYNFIEIKTDILQILKQPKSIDFSILSVINNSQNGAIIAENYLDMFSIIH
jgi:hypothetical protein